mgnify:FL=1
MFKLPHYYNKPENKPECEKSAGGDNWYSDDCLCFMSNGTYELLKYLDFEDGERWNNQCDNTVVAWMEI